MILGKCVYCGTDLDALNPLANIWPHHTGTCSHAGEITIAEAPPVKRSFVQRTNAVRAALDGWYRAGMWAFMVIELILLVIIVIEGWRR